MDDSGVIVLVEDIPNDVELTLAALGENRPTPGVVVASDGEKALDYLFRRGTTGRDLRPTPGWYSSTSSCPKWAVWRCSNASRPIRT